LSRKRNPFVDGREAVTFLVRVKDVLEDPGETGAGFMIGSDHGRGS
jgi:hypothetical protein